MDFDKVLKEVISEIKEKWGLPKKGFLAGGSIANLAWEKVSGKKAIVNDIDIFVLSKTSSRMDVDDVHNKLSVSKNEKIVTAGYNGYNIHYIEKEYYIIDEVIYDGIHNIIHCNSNTGDVNIILDSFDLNCCRVGYDIEKDKIYYKKDFIEFLKTGEVRVTNLHTPAHTLIRLHKKCEDLNCEVFDSEIDLLILKMNNPIGSVSKRGFKDKYLKVYKKYEQKLKKYVKIEEYECSFDGSDNLEKVYTLLPIDQKNDFDLYRKAPNNPRLIYYFRNIKGNPEREKIWEMVSEILDTNFSFDEYFDEPNQNIEFLSKLVKYAPETFRSLYGLKLSEQIELTNRIFSKFPKLSGISLLEKGVDYDVDLDDEISNAILNISIRSQNVNDVFNKVDNIF